MDENLVLQGGEAKERRQHEEPVDGAGDTWTWTAIEAETKLLITWLVGGRDSDYAIAFMDDLRDRLANRVQLTSLGHRAYLEAVEGAFGGDVDYAQLVKLYGAASGKRQRPLQLSRLHRRSQGSDRGQPRSQTHLDPDDARLTCWQSKPVGPSGTSGSRPAGSSWPRLMAVI